MNTFTLGQKVIIETFGYSFAGVVVADFGATVYVQVNGRNYEYDKSTVMGEK